MTPEKKARLEADITAMFLVVSMRGGYDNEDVSVLVQAIEDNLLK